MKKRVRKRMKKEDRRGEMRRKRKKEDSVHGVGYSRTLIHGVVDNICVLEPGLGYRQK